MCRDLESSALRVLRDPVDQLLRFAFTPRVNRAVEAFDQLGAIGRTRGFGVAEERADENSQPEVSERNHCHALCARRFKPSIRPSGNMLVQV